MSAGQVPRDNYDVLGVSRDAGEADIKKAFRRLARELHPDVNSHDPEAEEKFKEAAEAYDVLSDPDRRATYDRYGHEGLRSGGYAPNFDTFGSVADTFEAFSAVAGSAARSAAAGARAARSRVATSPSTPRSTSPTPRTARKAEVAYEVISLRDNCHGSGRPSRDRALRRHHDITTLLHEIDSDPNLHLQGLKARQIARPFRVSPACNGREPGGCLSPGARS